MLIRNANNDSFKVISRSIGLNSNFKKFRTKEHLQSPHNEIDVKILPCILYDAGEIRLVTLDAYISDTNVNAVVYHNCVLDGELLHSGSSSFGRRQQL